MDPNATLAAIEETLANPAVIDDTRAAELRRDLLDWLDRGGFAPVWSRYPRATQYVRGLTVTHSDHTMQVIGFLTPSALALRIPRHLARPIAGGCQCQHCLAHREQAPCWDTLIVPLVTGAHSYTVHAPEWKIGSLPAHPAATKIEPVTGTDPRD